MGSRILFSMCVIVLLKWRGGHTCSLNKTESVNIGNPYYHECACPEHSITKDMIKWLNPHDKPIGPMRPGLADEPYTVYSESQSLSFYLPAMTHARSGSYKCIINADGKIYTQIHNLIGHEEMRLDAPEKQYITLGTKSLIKCEVHAEPNAEITTSWYFKPIDGVNIGIQNSEIYNISANKGLYINNVTDEDMGSYKCFVYDAESSDQMSQIINVEILRIPEINALTVTVNDLESETVYVKVKVGDTIKIECKGEGNPHPTYVFKKIDGELKYISTWQTNFNDIIIENVQPEDQGRYMCIAENSGGFGNDSVDIQVLIPPNITSFSDATVIEGNKFEFDCKAEGRPTPNVAVIYVPEDDSVSDNEVYSYDGDIVGNLTFDAVDRQHMGNYACNATNEVGYSVKYMFLNVEFAPVFVTEDELIWGWEGKVVNLSCEWDGNPPVNLTWRYLGGQNSDGTLEIDISKKLFEIVKTGETFVTVNTSNSPFPYGKYECMAKNTIGEALKTINFMEGHVPSSIKDVYDPSIQHTSATFKFIAPDSFEGPKIQGFTAEYDKEDNFNVTYIHVNRTWSVGWPYSLDNLEPNTTYLIRFAAINEVGNGPWTDYMRFQTPEPDAPDAPEWEIELQEVNITSLDQKIKWSPGNDHGAPIQYYVLQYCLEEEEEICYVVKIAGNDELKLDTSLLEFNKTYNINLTAHNAVGDSLATNLTVTMLAESLPPPALLSASALIGLSVVVVFICLLLLDLLLLMWRRQGIIASCCVKKKSEPKENLHTRDKKGLLNENRESEDNSKRAQNKPIEFEYNKTTGIITGRHSAV